MKTFENQAKKRFPLLVTLLLWKVLVFAQNIWHIKITAFLTRTSGCLPFSAIIYNISSGDQYVKTFPKTTFPWNRTFLKVNFDLNCFCSQIVWIRNFIVDNCDKWKVLRRSRRKCRDFDKSYFWQKLLLFTGGASQARGTFFWPGFFKFFMSWSAI